MTRAPLLPIPISQSGGIVILSASDFTDLLNQNYVVDLDSVYGHLVPRASASGNVKSFGASDTITLTLDDGQGGTFNTTTMGGRRK